MDGIRISRRGFLKLGAAAALLPACRSSSGAVDATAIVVGSGFGGAIAALRLTQAGIKTIIIERGRRWDLDSPPQSQDPFCTDLMPDGRAYWLRDATASPVGPALSISRYIGIVDRVDGMGMNVYRGAGYGGGSLVYGGVNIQPSQQRWQLTFPQIDYAEMNGKYFPRVVQMNRASSIPDDVAQASIYQYVSTFQAAASKVNMTIEQLVTATDWDAVRGELAGTIPASAINGELLYGNNSGSKWSVDRTYLKQAEQTGLLTVRPQSLVRNVSAESGGRYSVDVESIDETGKVISTQTLACKYLFLAAGSLGTTGILLQSRASGGLGKLTDQVGQSWGNNGDLMFSIAGYGATGKVQGSPPVVGVNDPGNSQAPVYAEVAPYPIGYDTKSTLHMSMTMTKTLGQVVLDASGHPIAQFPQSGIDACKSAVTETFSPLLDANNLQMDTSVSSDGWLPGFTYHPLGGASMNAVCDTYGRVQGYPGLYVVDGALLPGPGVGVNPALTIAALAERALEEIVTNDLK